MKATLLFHRQRYFDDGAILEMKIWLVADQVLQSAHDLKYSLFYGRPGQRIIGYDNERGKGDHCHRHGTETAYLFTTVQKLVADFLEDVRQERGET